MIADVNAAKLLCLLATQTLSETRSCHLRTKKRGNAGTFAHIGSVTYNNPYARNVTSEPAITSRMVCMLHKFGIFEYIYIYIISYMFSTCHLKSIFSAMMFYRKAMPGGAITCHIGISWASHPCHLSGKLWKARGPGWSRVRLISFSQRAPLFLTAVFFSDFGTWIQILMFEQGEVLKGKSLAFWYHVFTETPTWTNL